VTRYLRLYLHFLRFSISRAMEFRVDFFFRIVMDVVYYAVNLAFFSVLFGHTTELGSWDLDQVYVFVCGFLWVDAAFMTVVANNMWWLPIYINRGDLDYHLVRPVSSLFMLSLRDFAANSFVNLVLASGLLVWSLVRYPAPLDPAFLLLFLAMLGLGVFFHWAVRILFIVPVFWIHSGRGLDEVAWQLVKLAERPHQIYQPWLRAILLTVLPLALCHSVPAHVLFSGPRPGQMLGVAAVVCGFAIGLRWLWNRALRSYSSASS